MMRGVSVVGAACVMAVALWSAGLPPAELWKRAEQWLSSFREKADQPVAPVISVPAIPATAPATQSVTADEILAGTDSSISVTPLPLYLLSTFPGRNSRDGTALIGISTTNPQTYSAGALLANGAQLAEIYRDHVVLKRGDRSAKLSLYRLSDALAKNETLDDLLMVGSQTSAQLPTPGNRDMLTDYLRPSPVYEGEVLSGYQVYPGQKSGVFAQMGLHPGDVITSINGVPFSDPAQAMQLFEQIAEGVAVVATVVRKNKTERITLDGSLITADQDRRRNAASSAPPMELPSSG